MLMTEAVDLSQDNELGKQVSDLSASGSSPKFNLFKALDKNTQEHVLAALPPDTATSFVESAVNELAQNNNDAELIDLTGTLAQTRPEAFQAMSDTAMLSLAKTMEQSETPGMFTAKGKDPFGQVVQALSPSQLKTLAKTGQPTGKIAAALRQNNPAALLANVYDQNTTPEEIPQFTESFVNAFKKDDGTMDWQALGKAGNKNPKLMAKVLNQLQQDSASNTLVKELGEFATAGESLEKGIVLAMIEQNNLEFMTSFDAMPASIQDLARDIILPTRPAQTAAPAPPQKADETSQKGFAGPKMSAKTQAHLLGLSLGLSATALMGDSAKPAINQALMSKIKEAPEQAATIRNAAKGLGQFGANVTAQVTLAEVLQNPDKIDEMSDDELTTMIGLADFNAIPTDQNKEIKTVVDRVQSKIEFNNMKDKQLIDSFVNKIANNKHMSIKGKAKRINKFMKRHNQSSEHKERVENNHLLNVLKTTLCVRGYANAQELQSVGSRGDGAGEGVIDSLLTEGFNTPSTFVDALSPNTSERKKGETAEQQQTRIRQELQNRLSSDVGQWHTAVRKEARAETTENANVLLRQQEGVLQNRMDVMESNLQTPEALKPLDDYLDQPDSAKVNESQARVLVNDIISQQQDVDPQTAVKLMSALEKQHPGIADQSFKTCLQDMIKGMDADTVKTVFQGASIGVQQTIIDSVDDPKVKSEFQQSQIAQTVMNQLSAPWTGIVSSSQIDQQQLAFQADVETALSALPDGVNKQDFLAGLIDQLPASFRSQGPNSNAIQLARLRGLQQTIQKDSSLTDSQKAGLNQTMCQTAVAALLTSADHQLPVSDRSLDHMAHVLYGLDPASQDAAAGTLANHMAPADFKRLQSRVALHCRATKSTQSTTLATTLRKAKRRPCTQRGACQKWLRLRMW